MPKRVLIVDDDPNMCLMLKGRLETAGLQADVATGGLSALGMFTIATLDAPYDLVLLDILLPQMDGKEVLKMIRRFEQSRGVIQGKGVPIIMLTALHNEITTSFTQGCDDYVLKPFDPEILLEKILSKLK